MRIPILAALLLGVAACSPTTDITRTSTEPTAERSAYEVVDSQARGDQLQVKAKVWSLASARTVAEDIIVKRRQKGFDRIQVAVYGWNDDAHGSPAGGVLRWSTKNGFDYSRSR